MNTFIFWSVHRFFAVRFAHSMASFAGLPGSGGLQLCFSLLSLLLRRQTQVFCFSFDSKEKRTPSPSNFCFTLSHPHPKKKRRHILLRPVHFYDILALLGRALILPKKETVC